jgi:hypothetical protein
MATAKNTRFDFKGRDGNYAPLMMEQFMSFLLEKKLIYDLSTEQFLNIEEGGIKNSKRIVDLYTPKEKKLHANEIENNEVPYIKPGTTVYLPNDSITAEMQKILGSDIFLEQTEFNAFWTEVQQALLKDSGYVPFDAIAESTYLSVKGNTGIIGALSAQVKALNIRIWVYVRALGKMFDISPWVVNCSTSKDKSAGSFSIEVSYTSTLQVDSYGNEFVNQESLMNQERKLNQDWFSKFVQNNDLIFIRFEQLKMERYADMALAPTNNKTYEVPVSDLGTVNTVTDEKTGETKDIPLIWDMLGLVDSVRVDYSSNINNYSIQIEGRDYTKLFVEDGSYFIPLKFVEGSPDQWFYGGDPESAWFKRNMITGAYDYYFAYSFQRIANVIWFVINQLSSIGIVDDSLFASCAKITEKLPVETGDDKYKQKDNKVKGIWQMVRVFVDEALEDRRIVDRSLVNPEGTLLDFFNKVCQEPFVEFWGDTYMNEFDLIVRQPPFTGKAVKDVINSESYITIASQDLLSLSLQYDDRVYAWYRIMPQNAMMGNSQFSSLAFVPIIFFNEYCELYGNKRCITNDIYISEKSFMGRNGSQNLNTLSQALVNDLLFVIETSAYLPFTRKGTITINGDRRIKVGTFIFLEATNELFYVTAVTNTATFGNEAVDRTTIVTVERGMLVDLIDGENSYFNIVNLEGLKKEIAERGRSNNTGVQVRSLTSSENNTVTSFKNGNGLNTSVFRYFVNRQKFQEDAKFED